MQQFRILPALDVKAEKPKKRKGDKIKPVGNKKYPDELVLAIRTAHEIDRKSRKQIERMYPDLSSAYIYDILNYTIRAKLRVKPI